MDIKIPNGLGEYKLYALAKKIISEYELDEVNLNEFPIRVFNKMANSLGRSIDQDFKEKLDRAFSQKGSYRSVKSLLEIFNITSSIETTGGEYAFILKIDIDVDILNNLDFLNYLSDCISYLIFFNDLIVKIRHLLVTAELKPKADVSAVSANIQFIIPTFNFD